MISDTRVDSSWLVRLLAALVERLRLCFAPEVLVMMHGRLSLIPRYGMMASADFLGRKAREDPRSDAEKLI